MHALKELGVPIWKVVLGFTALSAVNLVGFLSEIPRAFWLFIDGYAVTVYFFFFSLAVSASAFTALIASAVLYGFLALFSSVKDAISPPDEVLEEPPIISFRRVLEVLIFLIAFGSLFSGSSYVNYVAKHLMLVVFLLVFGYFMAFIRLVRSGEYEIAEKTPKRLIAEFLYDMSPHVASAGSKPTDKLCPISSPVTFDFFV